MAVAALAFWIFMLMLLLVGGGLLLAALILFFTGRRQKKRGAPWKWYRLPFGLLLAMGLFCTLPPVGSFLLVRSVNASSTGYQDTGVYARWGEDGTLFIADRRYVRLTGGDLSRNSYLPCDTAVATLKGEWDDSFWAKLWGYRSGSNLYAVENEAGFDLVSYGYRIYCLDEELEDALAFYQAPERYALWGYASGAFDQAENPLDLDRALWTQLEEAANEKGNLLPYTEPGKERRVIHLRQISRDGVISLGSGYELMEVNGALHLVLDYRGADVGEERGWTYTLAPLPSSLATSLSSALTQAGVLTGAR